MEIDPLSPFGLRISGVDVTCLTDDARATVVDACNRVGVVVIADQSLSPAEQERFTEAFGEIRRFQANPGRSTAAASGIVDISNVGPDGTVLAPDSRTMQFSKANQLWHTDYSYSPEGAAQSILYAIEAGSDGGETEVADMVAAYAALPAALKEEDRGCVATHDLAHSRALTGYRAASGEAEMPKAQHPLVKRHPHSAAPALYLGSQISQIDGVPPDKTSALLERLMTHATAPRFIYRHTWRPGDVLIWDNRSTLHRGRPFDPATRRVMRRTAVAA